MGIPNTNRMKRRPTHPGEMLREDFLPDYGLSVSGLATELGVSRQSVNGLLRERRAVSPEMTLRLARLFGNSAEFWVNAQRAVDLWDAAQAISTNLKVIAALGLRLHVEVAHIANHAQQDAPTGARTSRY